MSSTLEPVTVGGWYEHDDGTVSEYYWHEGQLKTGRTAASWAEVPTREQDERAAFAADQARFIASQPDAG